MYKSWAKALVCLEHLTRFCSEDPVAEIIIIQDEPGATSPAALQQFGKVVLVHNEENLGYVKSVNKGISLATCQRVVLLDSDAWVKNSLSPLVSLLGQETGVVLATPQGVNEKGVKTRMFFPAPSKWSLLLGQRMEGIIQGWLKRPPLIIHSYAWAICKPAWEKLDGLDENYRFIESDIDYCLRVHRFYPDGIAFCPTSVVQHEGGSSLFRQNQRVMEWYRSRFYTHRKYFSARYIPLLKWGVRMRLTLEKGLAGFLTRFQKSNQKIWQQKKQGRSELLSNLHSW